MTPKMTLNTTMLKVPQMCVTSIADAVLSQNENLVSHTAVASCRAIYIDTYPSKCR